VLLTRPPLSQHCIATALTPFDLHVLGTPPAFVLSQDQTLINVWFVEIDSGLLKSFQRTYNDTLGPEPSEAFSKWVPR
jgi:hypothetical protein